jgi:hypothetical protein
VRLSEKKSDKNKTGEKMASKTLKVTTDKTRYRLGDEIKVIVTNTGDEPVEFTNRFYGLVLKNVRDPTSKVYDYSQPYALAPTTKLELPPGKSNTIKARYDNDLAERIGTGSIQAVVTSRDGKSTDPITLTTTQSVDTTCLSFREDCTGRLGWMYLLYLGLKPNVELYELVEFTIKYVADPGHMSDPLRRKYKNLVYPSLVPGLLDTVTTTQYATDTISALDFDRATTNDRLFEDKVSSKGGLKSLLIERGVEGLL